MFPALLTTILFSISAVCANRSTRMLGSIPANFWRLLLATVLLGLYAHGFSLGIAGPAFPIFFVSGIVGFGVGDFALYQALPRLGSRLSILLVHCLAAPVAALTEWFWLGTPLSLSQALCGVVILAGVALALAPGKHLQLSRRELLAGIVFGVLAALGQSFGAVLSRKAYGVARQTGENIDGITAAYQRILGGLLVALLCYLAFKKFRQGGFALPSRSEAPPQSEHPTSNIEHPTPNEETAPVRSLDIERSMFDVGCSVQKSALPWIVVNALSGPVLGVSCYQWALKTIPTGVVLPIVAVTPIVIIPFSLAVEGERPTPRSLAGGVIAVAGVVGLSLVTRPAL